MNEDRPGRWAANATTWLPAFVCCGVAALAWFGYRATDEWQRSSALLMDRRSQDAAELLTTALTRDMRGVQTSILTSQEESRHVFEPPYEINDLIAVAFARYPYPECFFGWATQSALPPVFFARTDRRSPWLTTHEPAELFPVEVVRDRAVADLLRSRVLVDAASRHRFSIFDTKLAGATYQVVALLSYQDVARRQLQSVFGFMVNLDWARNEYFGAITRQVSEIAGTASGIEFVLTDENRRQVVGTLPANTGSPGATRQFPVLFFDPTLTMVDPPSDLAQHSWTIRASAARDPAFALAARGARRTLVVVAAAAITLGVGLLFTARAARVSSTLTTVRADFVSTVTHELKTPLSTIRAVGETLIRGRVKSDHELNKYARILVQEERRLTRLVNNLLAYAQVTDVIEIYSFQALDPRSIAAEALQGFRRQLSDSDFRLEIDMPPSLPQIKGDRTALVLALDNLIDNAIRYSGNSSSVSLRGTSSGREMQFHIVDRGVGIPIDELALVRRRFVRGRAAKGNGNGLGLAIVSRIAADHGGRLLIASEVGVGTTVTLTIPTIQS